MQSISVWIKTNNTLNNDIIECRQYVVYASNGTKEIGAKLTLQDFSLKTKCNYYFGWPQLYLSSTAHHKATRMIIHFISAGFV